MAKALNTASKMRFEMAAPKRSPSKVHDDLSKAMDPSKVISEQLMKSRELMKCALSLGFHRHDFSLSPPLNIDETFLFRHGSWRHL